MRAIGPVLEHEGGYVNHPADPGGETKYGITKRNYPNLDIKSLTREQAIQIYFHDYWKAYMDQIHDYRIAAKLFDMSVNMGHSRANKIVQKAAGVEADGVIGPHTLEAINSANADELLKEIISRQLEFYDGLVDRKPEMIAFLKGWSNRASWVPSIG